MLAIYDVDHNNWLVTTKVPQCVPDGIDVEWRWVGFRRKWRQHIARGPLVLVCQRGGFFSSQKCWSFNAYFTNYWTKARHVCTFLNEFSIVIPNVAMKLKNSYIFDNLLTIFVSFFTCRLKRIPLGNCFWLRLIAQTSPCILAEPLVNVSSQTIL